MTTEQLLQNTNRLIARAKDQNTTRGAYAEACEFLRLYGGPRNEFLAQLREYPSPKLTPQQLSIVVPQILESFAAHIQAGLHAEISPERKAQLDVVSDFLEQASRLLQTPGIHPAAPAVIIGASLEEFLRTLVEANALSLGDRKPSIDNYAKALREADLLTKQDMKDITAWAGLRNHAAHGEWEEVNDAKRVSVMLEGVNLFMRQKGAATV